MLSIQVIVAALMLPVLGVSAAPAEPTVEKPEIFYQDPETGEQYTQAYEVTEDGLRPLSVEEFKNFLAQSKKDVANLEAALASKQMVAPADCCLDINRTVTYNEIYSGTVNGTPYAVTNTFYCPPGSTGGCTSTHLFSTSQSERFSANVDVYIKPKIRAGASFTWNTSASISSSYTLSIPAGKSGRIMFMPYFDYTFGKATITIAGAVFQELYVDGYSPQKLQTGELRGLVYGEIS